MASHDPFAIQTLGKAEIPSPLLLSKKSGDEIFNFVDEKNRVLVDVSLSGFLECLNRQEKPESLEKAGPRENIFFNPAETTAAIVTCGGLCPGINNVIRSLVMALYYFYGVRRILGIRYGYEGLSKDCPHEFLELTPDRVKDIHEFGGTILGSSRGAHPIPEMVDTLVRNRIDLLFTIGGDGTLKGARAIGEEIEKRNLKIAVAGIPKTIDNDINLIDKSFGFETAFDVASPIVRDAHNEAIGAYNGIAIVKLMGRDSGFIAASTAFSMPVVNFVLIPEMTFELDGPNGFLKALENRLDLKHHAVIVVAEGAGQHLFETAERVTDASGNVQHNDIGKLLKDRIQDYFRSSGKEVTIKYIDPSYIIRSAPANAKDSQFCNWLAYQAVHGAMCGKTKFVVGRVNNRFVYLPISRVVDQRKKIDTEGEFWFGVLQSTGQPFKMN